MKTLIIYKSIHLGNTERVAESMAEVLQAQLLKTHQMDKNILPNYDLIGLGSGIYFGRHHRSLLTIAEKCLELKDKKVFIFSTSCISRIPLLYEFHRPLRIRIKNAGCQILGAFSCRGKTEVGPLKYLGGIHKNRPGPQDLKRAEQFAHQLAGKFEEA